MYLWRKRATSDWLRANGDSLQGRFGSRMAVIEQPDRKRTTIEICYSSRRQVAALRTEFGGNFEAIPRNWRRRIAATAPSEPIRIGRRLVITNVGVGGASAPRSSRHKGRSHINEKPPPTLVIPAAAAFGTGEHATTAMCLRLLERKSRHLGLGWNLLDAGTGTGILALAAKCFGARGVVAIDSDPRAISNAKRNARANRIYGIQFRVADVKDCEGGTKLDFITANLYSELLIKAFPVFIRRLKPGGHLILSGVLREQARAVTRSLRARGFAVEETRRRGKWVAILTGIVAAVSDRRILGAHRAPLQ